MSQRVSDFCANTIAFCAIYNLVSLVSSSSCVCSFNGNVLGLSVSCRKFDILLRLETVYSRRSRFHIHEAYSRFNKRGEGVLCRRREGTADFILLYLLRIVAQHSNIMCTIRENKFQRPFHFNISLLSPPPLTFNLHFSTSFEFLDSPNSLHFVGSDQ